MRGSGSGDGSASGAEGSPPAWDVGRGCGRARRGQMYPARALIMGMEERQQLLVGLWTMMTAGEGGSRVPPAGSAPCCVQGPGGSSD